MSFTPQDIKKLRETTGAGMMDCKKALNETSGDIEKATDWLRKNGINTAQKKSGRSASDGLITIDTIEKKGIIVEVNSETDFVAKNDNFKNFCKMVASICIDNEINSLDILMESKFDKDTLVKDELTNLVSKLGENIVIRRLNFIFQDENYIQTYIHNSVSEKSGKIGVIISYSVTNNTEEVKAFSKQIAMHIAALDPKSMDVDSLDQNLVNREREIFTEQLSSSGKPPEILEKIIDGKIKKFYGDVCLLEQFFVIDNKTKVKDIISLFNKKNETDYIIKDYLIYKLGS